MKKFGVLAGLLALALLLGMAGTAVRGDRAQAMPEDVVAIPCGALAGAIDGDPDNNIVVPNDIVAACDGLTAAEVALLADALGDEDGTLEASDLPEEPTQVWEDGTAGVGPSLYIFAFVDDDGPVTFDLESGGGEIVQNAGPGDWVCDTAGEDHDCTAAVEGDEDGVVVAWLVGNGADRGDHEIEVNQEGEILAVEYTVVGGPDTVTLIALEETISEEIDDETCRVSADDIEDDAAEPDKALLVAIVTDDDDVQLYGVSVLWDSEDDDIVALGSEVEIVGYEDAVGDPYASDKTTTTELTTGDIGAVNLACGGEPGEAEITAIALEADGTTEADDDSVVITVVGGPADMTLTASPASITCDGTASSTVSATLVDAEGNPVVAGFAVRFDVVALGVADPIVAETDAEGVASSTITPLSGISAGVVVNVRVLNDGPEGSIRVDCAAPAPTVVPPPPPVAPPTVVPPPTGDAGLLD